MCEDGIEEKRCKGVKKNFFSKSIHFDDYKRSLFSQKEQMRKMNFIRSRGHELFTEEIDKVVLSRTDDKIIIYEDKNNMLSHRSCLELK